MHTCADRSQMSVSIMENLQAMGVPIPDFITQKAHAIGDEINHGDGPDGLETK